MPRRCPIAGLYALENQVEARHLASARSVRASLDGLVWAAQLSPGLPYRGRLFGYAFLLLFPAAWLLLSPSISKWWLGPTSYLCVGLVFVLLGAGLGEREWSAAAWLLWPHFALVTLGMFGWASG